MNSQICWNVVLVLQTFTVSLAPIHVGLFDLVAFRTKAWMKAYTCMLCTDARCPPMLTQFCWKKSQ